MRAFGGGDQPHDQRGQVNAVGNDFADDLRAGEAPPRPRPAPGGAGPVMALKTCVAEAAPQPIAASKAAAVAFVWPSDAVMFWTRPDG